MNRIIPLLILVAVSCDTSQRKFNNSNLVQDSIAYYYDRAKDNQFSLETRLEQADKALHLAEFRNLDTTVTDILYHKNWLYLAAGSHDSLIKYHPIFLNKATLINDTKNLARQHYLMGYYYDHIASVPDSAFSNFNRSRNYFQRLNDSTWVANNLLNMAVIQNDQSDYFGSKETITEALNLFHAREDSSWIASAYNVLGNSHRKLYNYEDAETYLQKAIQSTSSPNHKATYTNNLGAVFIDQKRYKEAIDLFQEILRDSSITDDPENHARIIDNLAYARWRVGEAVADDAFKRPIAMRKAEKDRRGLVASYTHLGEYYTESAPLLARTYYDSVIKIARDLKYPAAERDVLQQLMGLEPNNLTVRNRYIKLQDSLNRATTKVKTQFAKYKYDDRLKQESILRLEKESAEQKLLTARQRFYTIASFAALGIVIIIFVLLYYLNLQRTRRLKVQSRADRLQAIHATEASLSRRLHDQFGAGLNHLMLLLQRNTPVSQLLDLVENLYQQSRDLSREINEVDTGARFEEELRQMLIGLTPSNTRLINGSKAINWDTIDGANKIVIFRVLRELMLNMRKHSNAKLVNIQYFKSNKKLKIKYADNGDGASETALYNKNGLLNTEKRIQTMDGTITFDSEKGKGFRAEFILPNFL